MSSKECDFWFFLVSLMPKKLVYFCAVVITAKATAGKYSRSDPATITAIEAMKRFEVEEELFQ